MCSQGARTESTTFDEEYTRNSSELSRHGSPCVPLDVGHLMFLSPYLYAGGPMLKQTKVTIPHYSRREPSGSNKPSNGDSSGDVEPPEQ